MARAGYDRARVAGRGAESRSAEASVQIDPFFVEQWMNAHETTATWNIAETCVHSLTFDELLEMSGDADGVVRRLRETWLGYGDIVGSPRLRAAIAALYGERITPDHVLTANGAIGANFLALYALVEPGTTVVTVQPTYQQLFSVPASLGAEVRELRLREEDGYLPDPDAIRALSDERTRLIVLNNPNNPTGALIDEPLLREIVEVARERDAWLFCDEVYRMLEHEPGSTAPSVADLYEKGVSSGSMSKSYSLAGLRTGWVAGPREIIERCLDVRDYTTISGGVLDDALAAVALENKDRVLRRSLEIVRGNLAVVDEWIAREPRLRYVRPRAGTIALIRYDYDLPSVDFCQGMFDFSGAFVMPGVGLRRGARVPPRLRVRPRRARGRAGGRVRVPADAGGLRQATAGAGPGPARRRRRRRLADAALRLRCRCFSERRSATSSAASSTEGRHQDGGTETTARKVIENRSPCPGEEPRPYTSPVSASPRAVPMPRVMLSTPEATPDSCFGADDMIAALLDGVKSPSPTPTRASPATSMPCPGCDRARTVSVAATRTMPHTVSGRAPTLSARRPANGATRPRKHRHDSQFQPRAPRRRRRERARGRTGRRGALRT